MSTLIFCFATCTALVQVRAQEPGPTIDGTDANGYRYEAVTNDPFGVRIYTLDNGLKVYLRVNRERPRIDTRIVVRAGSASDPANATGHAHLVEHMAFKGTSRIGTTDWGKESALLERIYRLFERYRAESDPKTKKEIYAEIDNLSGEASAYAIANEYDKLEESIGVQGSNAYTDFDSTIYTGDIPSNELEKWVKLERERFSELVLRLFHTELETVWEEFNMEQEDDNARVNNALMSGLFQKHPYGTQTVLGSADHLKNPSPGALFDFWRTEYVPNNMAICMSGDLDIEQAIKLVDGYWGNLKRGDVPEAKRPVEEEIRKPVAKEMEGPDAEFVTFAFRFGGRASEDVKYVQLIDALLSNTYIGLLDLDLLHKQRVLGAASYASFMRDYGVHQFYVAPRSGQALDQVKDLVLEEIEKVKRGEFEDWALDAIRKNLRLSYIALQEGNGIVDMTADSFVSGLDWLTSVRYLQDISRFSKEDIARFARERYTDNYVVVYKRRGRNGEVTRIEKPAITPVKVNREEQSAFFKEFEKEAPERLTPVFVDFSKDIETRSLQPGVELSYVKNRTNELFSLEYAVEIGRSRVRELPHAVDYLSFLGTDEYTPEEIRKAFYRLGASFDVYAGDERCYVRVSGPQEAEEKSVELLEHLLSRVKPDGRVYKNYVKDTLRSREDEKRNRYTILWGALYNYGKYGKDSPFTDRPSTKELKRERPEELVALVKNLFSYRHKVLYYGPSGIGSVEQLLKSRHRVPESLEPLPPRKVFPELPTEENKVYFVNYDMVQTDVYMLSKGERFNLSLLPAGWLFNEYYGATMASPVFQEIREAKGLAYEVYAGFDIPARADESHYVHAFVGTQPGKLEEAARSMLSVMNGMPRDQKLFDLSKDAVLKGIESARIIKADLFRFREESLLKGIDHDYRKEIYEKVKAMNIDDLGAFFDEHIKDRKYTFLVMGRKRDVDMKVLRQLGSTQKLTLKKLFSTKK